MKMLMNIAGVLTLVFALLTVSCNKADNEIGHTPNNNEPQLFALNCLEKFGECIDCCHENDCGHNCNKACYAAYINCKQTEGSTVADVFLYPKHIEAPQKITRDTESFVVRIDNVYEFDEVLVTAGRGIGEGDSIEYEANLDLIGKAEYNSSLDIWVIKVSLQNPTLSSMEGDIDFLGIEVSAITIDGSRNISGDFQYIGAGAIVVEE